jgi:hypothetical protein
MKRERKIFYKKSHKDIDNEIQKSMLEARMHITNQIY